MTKYILSISGLAVFCYAATVLFQYGYLSYFNIPAAFLKGSIADNIVFAHDLLRLGLGILAAIRWWWTILIFFVVFVILSVLHQYKTLAAFAVVVVAYGFYNFGSFSAQSQTAFLVPESGCPVFGPEKNYVAAVVSDGKAIFVSIDDNRHLKPGFMVKDVSALPCGLELRDIGTIQK